MLSANSKKNDADFFVSMFIFAVKIKQCFLKCCLTTNLTSTEISFQIFNTSIFKSSLHSGGMIFRNVHLN